MAGLDLGPHAAFILWAYAIAFAVIAGLVLWTLLDVRQQKRRIADLERRGAARRSQRPEAGP